MLFQNDGRKKLFVRESSLLLLDFACGWPLTHSQSLLYSPTFTLLHSVYRIPQCATYLPTYLPTCVPQRTLNTVACAQPLDAILDQGWYIVQFSPTFDTFAIAENPTANPLNNWNPKPSAQADVLSTSLLSVPVQLCATDLFVSDQNFVIEDNTGPSTATTTAVTGADGTTDCQADADACLADPNVPSACIVLAAGVAHTINFLRQPGGGFKSLAIRISTVTMAPSAAPSAVPSAAPSVIPSAVPSAAPSVSLCEEPRVFCPINTSGSKKSSSSGSKKSSSSSSMEKLFPVCLELQDGHGDTEYLTECVTADDVEDGLVQSSSKSSSSGKMGGGKMGSKSSSRRVLRKTTPMSGKKSSSSGSKSGKGSLRVVGFTCGCCSSTLEEDVPDFCSA